MFGGGFYCGKVGDIYLMNRFCLETRAAYTNPGEKIQWYTAISWPADALSWTYFRGKVLAVKFWTKTWKGVALPNPTPVTMVSMHRHRFFEA